MEAIDSLVNGIPNFIIHPQFTGVLLIVKIVFIAISFLLVIGIVWLSMVSTWYTRRYREDIRDFKNFKPFDAKDNMKKWKRILKRLEMESEVENKLAILEADEFLDRMLKSLDYSGATLAEKFKQLDVETLPNLKSVIEAHEVRNNIVRSREVKMTADEARAILNVYQQALTFLGAL